MAVFSTQVYLVIFSPSAVQPFIGEHQQSPPTSKIVFFSLDTQTFQAKNIFKPIEDGIGYDKFTDVVTYDVMAATKILLIILLLMFKASRGPMHTHT